MIYTIVIYLLFVIAIILAFKFYFRHEFTLWEMIAQFTISAIVISALFLGARYSQLSDVMIVNGKVTSTAIQKEQCQSGWRDYRDSFCTEYRTRSVYDGQTCSTVNGKEVCSPKYKTQYYYIYEWEQKYFVYTNIEDVSYEISRVDPQGANVPSRFSEIAVNDPISVEKNYTNYIQAAVDTLLNQKFEQVAEISYPSVRDYYKIRRVIYTNYPSSPEFVEEWNEKLSALNSEENMNGANVILNVTGHDEIWSEQLRQSWDAYNINDVIVTIGMKDEKISWVTVKSWSSSDIFNIEIRDNILNLGVIDQDKILEIIKNSAVSNNYHQRSMEEFKYLIDDIQTPLWVTVLVIIITLIATPVISYFFSTKINGDR